MENKTYSVDIDGKTLTAEFSDLAGQANGSVILKLGETAILVTAVMGDREQSGLGYFPLSVEFEERFYAAGQILGSRFVRREGRPSDEAVLSGRIVDRTIRPLFDSHIRRDVQIVVTVLAVGEDDPDVLAVIGASLALSVSDIPWNGPVAAVRIGKHAENGELVINPTYTEREQGELSYEILACGKDGVINMIECSGNEISEAEITHAFERASAIHKSIETFQKEIIAEIGKEKVSLPAPEVSTDVHNLFERIVTPKIEGAVFSGHAGKRSIHMLKDEWMEALETELPDEPKNIADDLFEKAVDDELHRGAIDDTKRPDGRGMDEIRPLYAQAGGVSPILHGSGIFYRGETHMFSALTLGGPQDSQILDTMEERETKKHFMHHYNFPPFSVGETGRVGGFNRRMIGHGALAEKALTPVIPPKETFPYTIRLVSETLSSNGSSSMGSVCGSTLALMDGGVPISRAVAGIASGLMMRGDQYVLLTDIQGPEDEHGDMDFKVAGTREGVTAIQMDVKVNGIPVSILSEALEKARVAREQILNVIEKEIPEPRAEISPRAPMIEVISINPTKIGLVIGGGGKTINKIKEDTGVEEITIEEDGTVFISGKEGSTLRAKEIIEALVHEFKTGEKVDGTVTKVTTFGAFVSLNEHTEGLVHISEIAPFRIERVEDVLSVGETVPVVVKSVGDDGKIALSIKARDAEFASKKSVAPKNTDGHTRP